MPDMYWVAPLAGDGFPVAAGTAFGTFTTFQDISPQPLPLIFGSQLRLGTKIELEAEGEYTCATGITLSIGFYYGSASVVLAQSAAITTGTTPTAWPFHIKYRGTIIGQGAAGSILGQGVLDLGTSLTAFSNNAIPTTAAARTVTIDTTTNKAVGVGAAWGTSGAGNNIKVNQFSALVLN